MNDFVNLICIIIISIIIFYCIFKDYRVCENFTLLNCTGIVDKVILKFFDNYKKENLFNEEKLKKYLENTKYDSEKDIQLKGMKYNNRNILQELENRKLIKHSGGSGNSKTYKSEINKEDINYKYIFDLLSREVEDTTDEIIKVTKQSDVFDYGIIDIGKIAINSN